MRNKVLFFIIISILLVTTLFGCSLGDTEEPGGEIEKEVYAVAIKIEESSIPTTSYAGEFDLSALRLIVTYSDGTNEVIGVDSAMISVESRDKLNKVGAQQIRVVHKNCSTMFSVVLSEKEKKYFTLRIYGGRPVAINDVAIKEEIEITGEYFEDTYVEGTVVTIEWIPIEGYSFNSWSDDNNALFNDSQSTTKATMNGNHTYKATSSPAVMTVNFETNCDISIGSKKTNYLYESDLQELNKEGYVFDGWTTEKLIGEDAIDCDAKKINFPYEIRTNNITLYGTWRRLGLEYISYTTAGGRTGYKVTSYEKNDKELVIPTTYDGFNVVAIGADAFKNATKLEELVIPATVEEIEDGFVRNCARLKAIEVTIGSTFFVANDGVLYNYNLDEIIAYPAGKITPVFRLDGVKVIHDYCFYNAIVGGLELTSALRQIGDYAFNTCHIDYVDMVSVSPSEIGFSVGNDIFDGNITHLLMANDTVAALFKNYTSIAAFADKFTTSSEKIPNIGVSDEKTLLYKEINNANSDTASGTSVEIIGVDRSLSELIIPLSLGNYDVSSLGVKSFNGCMYLENVIIPSESRLERVLDDAFVGTPYLENLSSKTIIANGTLYKYLGEEEVFKLDPSIEKIAESAFQNNTTLKKIDLSDNNKLNYIGPFAFYGCTSLVGTADEVERGFYVKKDLEAIGNYAFTYSAITKFELSTETKLASIGKEAFSHCYYLTSVELGANTKNISEDAFLYCYALSSFSVNEGNDVFVSIDGVLYSAMVEGGDITTLYMYPAGRMDTVFDIANSVSTYTDRTVRISHISDYAFFMSNVAALVLPQTVTSISSYAVYIPGLEYIEFAKINDGVTYNDIFVRGTERFEKYAPKYVVAKEDDSNLSAFFNNNNSDIEKLHRASAEGSLVVVDNLILKIVDGISGKQASVIKTDRQVTEIVIGEKYDQGGNSYFITEIGSYAFMGYYLNKITLGNRISAIMSDAMSYAYNMVGLYLPASGTIPSIEEDTFGDKFNNGLFVYLPQDKISSLMSNWGLDSDKYLIASEVGEPTATFGYREGEEPIIGTGPQSEQFDIITAEWISENIPERIGYSFGGWMDDNGLIIDFSEAYVIPYNIKLTCVWNTASYTVEFNVEKDKATLAGDSVVTVQYDQSYKFSIPIYNDGSKEFVSWKMADGTLINNEDKWTYANKGSVIKLYAEWKVKEFVLVYDVEVDGVAEFKVTYDRNYVLDIPTKTGFTFMGWALDEQGEEMLTNAKGESLLSWQYTDADSYNVYSIWDAETVTVNLYFTDGVLFKSVEQVYGAQFNFPYADITDEGWAQKSTIFCGWYDSFDPINSTGIGRRYTDETGAGLFAWDSGEETDLYAQWPLEISSGEELALLSDFSTSIILTQDITVVAPVGSGDTPYTGTFIGNGRTVTFNYNIDENTVFDGYVGLFAYNKGTIKDLKLQSNISITSLNKMSGDELFVGSIVGKNEGKIINSIVTKVSSDISASISVEIDTDANSYIGGFVGYNKNGMIKNVSMSLDTFDISIGGATFNGAIHGEKHLCGTVVGCMDGGIIGIASGDPDKADSNESFIYYYNNDNDPFKTVACGKNVNNTGINIGVSSSKKDTNI